MYFSTFSAYHGNSVPCPKMEEFQLEDPSTDRTLSIETLMEEVEPIVMGKYEFEYRDISKLLPFFGLFALSRFQRKDQDPQFFH